MLLLSPIIYHSSESGVFRRASFYRLTHFIYLLCVCVLLSCYVSLWRRRSFMPSGAYDEEVAVKMCMVNALNANEQWWKTIDSALDFIAFKSRCHNLYFMMVNRQFMVLNLMMCIITLVSLRMYEFFGWLFWLWVVWLFSLIHIIWTIYMLCNVILHILFPFDTNEYFGIWRVLRLKVKYRE